jgi:hypothetical protein
VFVDDNGTGASVQPSHRHGLGAAIVAVVASCCTTSLGRATVPASMWLCWRWRATPRRCSCRGGRAGPAALDGCCVGVDGAAAVTVTALRPASGSTPHRRRGRGRYRLGGCRSPSCRPLSAKCCTCVTKVGIPRACGRCNGRHGTHTRTHRSRAGTAQRCS